MVEEPAEVVDRPERHRFELRLGSRLIGLAAYRLDGDVLAVTHTEVEPSEGGRGLGTQLVRKVLDDARGRGRSVLPLCPFVQQFIERHPDYTELVPQGERARFGLAGPAAGPAL